jgi:hypothetical protein
MLFGSSQGMMLRASVLAPPLKMAEMLTFPVVLMDNISFLAIFVLTK